MADEKDLSIRTEIESMAGQFQAALPPQIPVERFVRIVMTAVNSSPDLISADRRSLFEAAMKAAQDGLLPDGREAAFVVYNTNVAPPGQQKRYIKKVQYLPMVWGVVKKVRNSGDLVTIGAEVVHENDEFDSWIDDTGPHFKHRKKRTERGRATLTYAYATTKDGGFFFEELMEGDIQAIRNVSRAKDSGPWAGPFEDEMRRKSAIRRLAKRLPMSADLDTVIRRDDELYDLNKHPDEAEFMPKRASEKTVAEQDLPTPAEIRGLYKEPAEPQTEENEPPLIK